MGVDGRNSHPSVAGCAFASRARAAEVRAVGCFLLHFLPAADFRSDVLGGIRQSAEGWKRIALANLAMFLWVCSAVFGTAHAATRHRPYP